MSALESFSGKSLKEVKVGWSLKDFTDFPCIQDWKEWLYYQISMDANFKEIDKEMDKYLSDLYTNKNFYFWKEKKFDYFEWVKHIFLKKDEFRKKYDNACVLSVSETAECVSEWKKEWAISVLWALDFILWANKKWSCYLLSETKSRIFLEVAYNWLLLNRQQTSRDELKKETQLQRENYTKFMEAIKVNQSYLERLNDKWTVKTKHTLNSR